MSRSTISIFELAALFPTEDVARVYLEARIWPVGPRCPDCGGENITARARVGFYRCNPCKFDFTIRTNTIFERSKVPLRTWIFAMYLVVTARKGISSMQLAKELQVTQKTAWFILARLREACSTPDNIDKLRGIIEIDETFVGGKEKNKHEHKKLKAGRGAVGKVAVLGMRERGGRTRAQVVEQRNLDFIHGEIHANVEVGSQLYTDDHRLRRPAREDSRRTRFDRWRGARLSAARAGQKGEQPREEAGSQNEEKERSMSARVLMYINPNA